MLEYAYMLKHIRFLFVLSFAKALVVIFNLDVERQQTADADSTSRNNPRPILSASSFHDLMMQ